MSQPLDRRTLISAVIGFSLYLLLVPALMFLAAGTLDWPAAWSYTFILLVASLGSRLVVLKRNPDTLRERAQFGRGKGTQDWDRVLMPVVGIIGPIMVSIVAGLDYRFGWTGDFSPVVQWLAAGLVLVGLWLAIWAMIANRYFSASARIQTDREQTVVASGPYRMVRHPAYAGGVLAGVALPFMLATLWALIPAVLTAIGTILRTALEDRMLREGLPGYQTYAQQTRYRLLLQVW